MKIMKLVFIMFLGITLVLGQTESIRQWSDIISKMRKSVRQDMSEQSEFDNDVRSVETDIDRLEKKMENTDDPYKKAEFQAETYSLQAELFIGKIIRFERKLELAYIFTGMMKDLTAVLFNKNGGSKIQMKFKKLVDQQSKIRNELRKTNQFYGELLKYVTVSSKTVDTINKYRQMTQRRIEHQKDYKVKMVKFYERQFTQLERMELQIIENYDPLTVELDIMNLEMELESLMLDAALHNIELQGDFINDMLAYGSSK